MTPEDLAHLHSRAFTTQRPWSAPEFASLLNSPHVFACMHPHAFALGRVIADEAELLTLATDPDQRRMGLGRVCLSEFLATATMRGALTAFLEVAADNAPAIALYDAAGFQRTATRPGYYSRPMGASVDALILSRVLG